MSLNTIFNVAFVVVYVVGILAFGVAMFKVWNDKRQARKALSDAILAKLAAGIDISARDVDIMARGSSLGRASISKCVSQLLLQTSDPKVHSTLRELALSLDKTEPFEDLPAEVKPSLLRLQELIETSSIKSDAHLLSPLQRALGSYVELKAELESSKRTAKWMNGISVIGFIVGLWGFYFAWKSPDSKEMEGIVAKALQQGAQTALPVAPPASTPSIR